jgi:hypothetical protein
MLKTLIYEGANRIKVLVTDFVTWQKLKIGN